jgi:hypothetical protein
VAARLPALFSLSVVIIYAIAAKTENIAHLSVPKHHIQGVFVGQVCDNLPKMKKSKASHFIYFVKKFAME